MATDPVLKAATSGLSKIPDDWMRATGGRALIFEDPGLLWLEFHGASHGFAEETSPYEFLEFIFEKSRQFERKWIMELAPEAIRVCNEPFEVASVERFQQTLELMNRSTPLIAQPALWWAPERIFGVPDLLVHTAWLRKHSLQIPTTANAPDHYVVLDIKFTTKLDSPEKKLDLTNDAAQVRIYSYIVGQLQRVMAQNAYLLCRDRITNPLEVPIHSVVGRALDDDLRMIRDTYLDIKINGAKYMPWTHREVEVNLSHHETRWHSAKIEIARNKVPGGDPSLVYEIGRKQKEELASQGFESLASLLKPDPATIPFELCRGLGPAKSPRIRAVLRANRSKQVTPTSVSLVPQRRPFEFYVDFEWFNDLNVDFDRKWPALEGCEMIFMVGVGWEENGSWRFRTFIAEEESQAHEYAMLEQLKEFLLKQTTGRLTDSTSAVLYHWTSAEVSQLRRAANRHNLDASHTLRGFPWYDLQKEVFLAEPIGVPGAWSYDLKEIASALNLLKWPGNLDDGLRATIAGWKAYKATRPLNSTEMKIVAQYNEVDCRAMWEIVRWLRGLAAGRRKKVA